MPITDPSSHETVRNIRQFDAMIDGLVPEIDESLLPPGTPLPTEPVSKLGALAERAFMMADKARKRDAEEPLPEIVQMAKDAQERAMPDGSNLKDSVHNDLGGGLWTAQINHGRLPDHINPDLPAQTRGNRFYSGTNHVGVWLELEGQRFFVPDGDERTHSSRVNDAIIKLQKGGGYKRNKYGPRKNQAKP